MPSGNWPAPRPVPGPVTVPCLAHSVLTTPLLLTVWTGAQRFREAKSVARGSTAGTWQGRICRQAEPRLCRTPPCPPGEEGTPAETVASVAVPWAAVLLAPELPDGRRYQRPPLVGSLQVKAFFSVSAFLDTGLPSDTATRVRNSEWFQSEPSWLPREACDFLRRRRILTLISPFRS